MLAPRSLTAILALLSTALTQSTSVTSLLLYGFEGDNLVASVISAAPQSIEYFVTCAPGTDSSDCGFGPGVTFTEGSSTLGIHLTESDEITMDLECAITSQTASCIQTVAGAAANFDGVTSAVITDISESLNAVTITAGLDLLSGVRSATATGSSSTSGTTTETAAATGASVTDAAATKTASSTAISGSATSSALATGAAHQNGQNMMAVGFVGLGALALML